MWLIPKRHQADFGDLQNGEIKLLAIALRDALTRLRAALDDPPYNYVIDTAAKDGLEAPHLQAIIDEMPSTQKPGWRTRVAPNKFPAVSQDIARCRHGPAFYETAAAQGHHEVVIESPRHDNDLAMMSEQEVRDVLVTYRSRYEALVAERAVHSVIVFRNHGAISGGACASCRSCTCECGCRSDVSAISASYLLRRLPPASNSDPAWLSTLLCQKRTRSSCARSGRS
jgi:galactose-1-phosphate uridylyltransferase